jgi:predicted acylesterase/phospholipase RssA
MSEIKEKCCVRQDLPPKYILSLDGGGIRGYFIWELLMKIKTQIGHCAQNTFDLFVGTSIGGLISLVLAQHTHCDPECKMQSFFTRSNMDTIFNKSIWDKLLGYAQFCPLYDGTGKRKVIEEHMSCLKMCEIKDKVALTTWNMSTFSPVVFKSYDEADADVLVADVADATSAAPIYFPAVEINEQYYLDGGVAANNPIFVAYTEGRKLWPHNPLYILSIGTGLEPREQEWSTGRIKGWGAPQWFNNGIVDILMDSPCTTMLHEVEKLMALNPSHKLLRLNGTIPRIQMDDCDDGSLRLLQETADRVWREKQEAIATFFGPKIKELSE